MAEVKGKMEVHGTDVGYEFAKTSNCASKFFAFINSFKGWYFKCTCESLKFVLFIKFRP